MGIAIWVIIVLVLALLAFVWIKLEHHLHVLKFAIITLVIILLGISVVAMFSSEKVDLSTPGGVMDGIYLYGAWLGSFLSQMWDIGLQTTADVVRAINSS